MTHMTDSFTAELTLFYIFHTETPRILEVIEPTSLPLKESLNQSFSALFEHEPQEEVRLTL